MKTEILLDQLDDKVRKGIATIIDIYGRFLIDETEDEENNALIELSNALACCFRAMIDVKAGKIADYEDLILKLAKIGEEK